MFGIEWAVLGTKVGGFFKKVFTSKWLYVGLAVLALAGGTYMTLNHWKSQAVTTAVKGADQTATVQSQKAGLAADKGAQQVDQKMDKLKVQTVKDYTNARATLRAAPQADRDAQAPAVIIDTINDLDRLRSGRDANPSAVPDPDVPVG